MRYADKVTLSISDVTFGKETDRGPGSFPGREYAALNLTLKNDSGKALPLRGVVVTVLDKAGNPVAPVYAQEVNARDFNATVAPGKTATARYGFAIPTASRSQVTIVVDFDSSHTSAVFSGSIS